MWVNPTGMQTLVIVRNIFGVKREILLKLSTVVDFHHGWENEKNIGVIELKVMMQFHFIKYVKWLILNRYNSGKISLPNYYRYSSGYSLLHLKQSRQNVKDGSRLWLPSHFPVTVTVPDTSNLSYLSFAPLIFIQP